MSASGLRPSLVNPRLWVTRRAFYYAVFERALMLLRDKQPLPIQEQELTRELSFTSVTARRQLDPTGRFDRPRFEAQNLPDPASNCRQPHEFKRPDIQWIHDDESVTDDRFREKAFVIECKRLGAPTSPQWILNEQYVIGGIVRFSSPEHRYGCYMSEGAMIAFVQSRDLPDVLTEINRYAKAANQPTLRLGATGWVIKGVSRLEHEFKRKFANSPFRLMHIWLDVRDVPTRVVAAKTKGLAKKTTKGSKNAPGRPKKST